MTIHSVRKYGNAGSKQPSLPPLRQDSGSYRNGIQGNNSHIQKDSGSYKLGTNQNFAPKNTELRNPSPSVEEYFGHLRQSLQRNPSTSEQIRLHNFNNANDKAQVISRLISNLEKEDEISLSPLENIRTRLRELFKEKGWNPEEGKEESDIAREQFASALADPEEQRIINNNKIKVFLDIQRLLMLAHQESRNNLANDPFLTLSGKISSVTTKDTDFQKYNGLLSKSAANLRFYLSEKRTTPDLGKSLTYGNSTSIPKELGIKIFATDLGGSTALTKYIKETKPKLLVQFQKIIAEANALYTYAAKAEPCEAGDGIEGFQQKELAEETRLHRQYALKWAKGEIVKFLADNMPELLPNCDKTLLWEIATDAEAKKYKNILLNALVKKDDGIGYTKLQKTIKFRGVEMPRDILGDLHLSIVKPGGENSSLATHQLYGEGLEDLDREMKENERNHSIDTREISWADALKYREGARKAKGYIIPMEKIVPPENEVVISFMQGSPRIFGLLKYEDLLSENARQTLRTKIANSLPSKSTVGNILLNLNSTHIISEKEVSDFQREYLRERMADASPGKNLNMFIGNKHLPIPLSHSDARKSQGNTRKENIIHPKEEAERLIEQEKLLSEQAYAPFGHAHPSDNALTITRVGFKGKEPASVKVNGALTEASEPFKKSIKEIQGKLSQEIQNIFIEGINQKIHTSIHRKPEESINETTKNYIKLLNEKAKFFEAEFGAPARGITLFTDGLKAFYNEGNKQAGMNSFKTALQDMEFKKLLTKAPKLREIIEWCKEESGREKQISWKEMANATNQLASKIARVKGIATSFDISQELTQLNKQIAPFEDSAKGIFNFVKGLHTFYNIKDLGTAAEYFNEALKDQAIANNSDMKAIAKYCKNIYQEYMGNKSQKEGNRAE